MPTAMRWGVWVLLFLLLLFAVLLFNTVTTASRQIVTAAATSAMPDGARASANLAAAIQLPTIASATDPAQNREQFLALHQLLQTAYPAVHATLTREVINDTALLFHWQGKDRTLPAVILMAHMDVVPIAPGTQADWQVPPFAGTIRDGFIWGRGAWDDKGNLIAQLEAVETLLASGFQPLRDVYLAYGADEEVNGERGAKAIAALLKSRGVRAEFVLDEGMLIVEDLIAGLDRPAALIGIAEKGYLSAKLTVTAEPGHSSMPPVNRSSAITRLSEVLLRLRDHERPAEIAGVAGQMFATLAPEMTGVNRLVLTNLWLLSPLVQRQLEAAPGTNALLRTTTAFTMLSAGNKDNVLPGRAEAVVNFRLLPGDSGAEVLAHIEQHAAAVLPPGQFTVTRLPFGGEASAVSSTTAPGYDWLQTTMRALEPETVVAPSLMLGATDARHFADIAAQIYRFSPIHAKPDDLPRFHGTNERLSLHDLRNMIRFYQELLQRAGTSR